MSSRGSDKSWMETTIGQAGSYVGRATSGRFPWALVGWTVLGLILLAGLIWFLRPATQPMRGGRGGFGGPLPVGVAQVAKGDIAIRLNALGTVTPLATVTVRPQVSGQVQSINFTEGQMVKQGDLLAVIDPRTFQAALDQAKGQLERDKATLANAQLDLKRQQGLMAQQATSQQALDTQLATVRSTAATVKSDAAAVETAAINLSYTRVTSPVSGRVGLRQVDIGNLVTAGQTGGIVVVTQLTPISVLFALPEDNISDIMSRTGSGATLSVDAYDRGQTVKLAAGTLATIDNVVDPTTGTVKLRAMFDNADGRLFPSQFVNVRVLVNTMKDQIFVPASAIERGAQGAYVYVVRKDADGESVAMRGVTLGPQDGDRVAITKGLAAGETVVTDGADRLRDGAEVVIPKGTKVSAGAPASAGSNKRAAMMKACQADIQKYCSSAGDDRRARGMCLREHRDDLGDECRSAMSKMRRGGGG